jgi:predicted phage tail protein
MTHITLHGILAKEFGINFKMQIDRAKNVLAAIDCNRSNFIKRVNELAQEGLNYTIIVDNKRIMDLLELETHNDPKEIHIIPLIAGAGIGAAILTAVLTSSLVGMSATAAAAFLATGMGMAISGLIGAVVMGAVSMGLQMLMAPKPDNPAPVSASTKAMQESYAFSNKVNSANQGSPVPIGYGRLKVGAQVIQTSVKSYPQNQNSSIAMSTIAYINATEGQEESSNNRY